MNPEDISPFDLERLLLGNAPAAFLLEVVARTAVIYLLIVVVVRLLGRRLSGQMTPLEHGVMIALGAIVAGAIQMPDRGIVPAAVLLVCLLALQRGLSLLTARYPRIEADVLGRASELVHDGTIVVEELERTGISQQHLFLVLRSNDVVHLGELRRVYLEACGLFSLVRQAVDAPGLSVLPSRDAELGGRLVAAAGWVACGYCGLVRARGDEQSPCERCGRIEWRPAVRLPEGVATDRGDEDAA